MTEITTIIYSLFVLAAACYLLFITSDPLEESGGSIGKFLGLPEEVISSTFQAMATSGPEIVMAIQAIYYTTDAKACSGLLNMGFSAMDNLVGIGCVGMIYMIYKGTVKADDKIELAQNVKVGLLFYFVSSTLMCLFITKDYQMNFTESLVMMSVGVLFILSQFYLPKKYGNHQEVKEQQDQQDGKRSAVSFFVYIFCVFGLWVFVRECLQATFAMASVGIVSIAGVLILFTSYVSSFPEFMMTYRYASKGKKDALLGMLFGSNVIDLAFSGFRCIWTGDPLTIVASKYLPIYLWLLPILALGIYIGISTGKMKYKHAYPMVAGYIIYIISGFILL